MNAVGKEKALKLIGQQLKAIPALRNQSAGSTEFKTWEQTTSLYVEKIFGSDSKNIKAFNKITFRTFVWEDGMDGTGADQTYRERQSFKDGLNESEVLLKRLIQELELFSENLAVVLSDASKDTPISIGKKVFVVHGHDEKLKAQVARFLEQLNLQPIILHEQPDRGQTIIEKFEKHSDVSFAVVLLTPDDVGGQADAKASSGAFLPTLLHEDEEPILKPRARQNVIFEFGYFLGKLERSNVCGLYCEGVELPSDFSGVLYTEVDKEGAWKLKLLKELKAAGFAVDANRFT